MDFNSANSQDLQNLLSMHPNFVLPNHQPTTEGYEEDRHAWFLDILKQNMDLFWNNQIMEINSISGIKSNHQLPLARIKRVMKSDADVKMISSDAPILFSKACELFILELTLRAWLHTEESRRRTLQRCDITKAIRHGETLDFLMDVIPFRHNHFIEGDQASKTNVQELRTLNPSTQFPFPVTGINVGESLAIKDNEVVLPHQTMINPTLPPSGFTFQSTPK